ncbi:MAG TPA: hypothetical protein VFU02_18375 [Polyangiaceae bacterium]|nr:hypothetical protein [Polyangiaceae bacterium]
MSVEGPPGVERSPCTVAGRRTHEILPIVRARVVKIVSRCSRLRGATLQAECDDIAQDILTALIANESHVLEQWHPGRGLSFNNYVGLFAERRALNACRGLRRRAGWESPAEEVALEVSDTLDGEAEFCTKDLLCKLLGEVEEQLSPQGSELLHRLFVRDEEPATIASELKISVAAVYQWRHRLRAAFCAADRRLVERSRRDSVRRLLRVGRRLETG